MEGGIVDTAMLGAPGPCLRQIAREDASSGSLASLAIGHAWAWPEVVVWEWAKATGREIRHG